MTRPQLVMLGAGHAHTVLLRQWARRRPAHTQHTQHTQHMQATLWSPSPLAPYSGMVPGWLAGRYRYGEICVDVRPLCKAAGVRWHSGEAHALEPDAQQLVLADGSRVRYDWLSINTGSTLSPPDWPGVRVLSLRPLADLRTAWDTVLAAPPPAHLLTAGGGAAGVEATLAVLSHLRQLHAGLSLPARLVTRSATLLPGMPARAQHAAHQALINAGVTVLTSTDLQPAMASAPGTLLLWATGATAPPWPRSSGLATDDEGFICVDATLRSISHPNVFASGDIARLPTPLPKAGVHAVRMGPLLARNLEAVFTGRPLKPYARNADALALIATADGRAIATRAGLTLAGPLIGRALWWWKDRIDRAFVRG